MIKLIADRANSQRSEDDTEAEKFRLGQTFKRLMQDAAVNGDTANAISAGREFGKLLDLYPKADRGSVGDLLSLAKIAAEQEHPVIEAADAKPQRLGVASDPYDEQPVPKMEAVSEEPKGDEEEKVVEPPPRSKTLLDPPAPGPKRMSFG